MPSDERRRTAQQIELIVGRLESLSTLPCVASKILDRTIRQQVSVSALEPIVLCDPAMMASALSLVGQRGAMVTTGARFSLRSALDRVGAETLADGLLGVRVFNPFGLDADLGRQVAGHRKDLLLHSLGVACCAKDLAEAIFPGVNSDLAWVAGLLHDVGKIALEEVMPKSFSRVVEHATGRRLPTWAVEQEEIGVSHAILGRRLANKWRFPLEVSLAIWLHHSDTEAVSQILPAAQIARIVQLADAIVLRSGIGESGSGGGADPVELAQGLDIDPNLLQPVYHRLGAAVRAKADLLGIDMPNAAAEYCGAAHDAIVKLSGVRRELARDNDAMRAGAGRSGLLGDFLESVTATDSALDIAEKLAVRWQRAFQTAAVCVYLAPEEVSDAVEVLLVEALGAVRPLLVEPPARGEIIPNAGGKVSLPNAHGRVDWLFEQLDVEFNPYGTRLLPLIADGRAIGAIVFELHYPDDAEEAVTEFRACAEVAATVLEMALSRDRDRRLAEHFMMLSPGMGAGGTSIATGVAEETGGDYDRLLEALAELAAGAAHELNNPLAVISGRAQLLSDSESDPKKREMLDLIAANSREAAGIIEGLMAFAQPPTPRPAPTDVRLLLEESAELALQRVGITGIDVRTQVEDGVSQVTVDSAQVASALANIICNAAESYGGQTGIIEISAQLDPEIETVYVVVTDYGCGMDADTMEKATVPFFSLKNAGRKRGMGLAFAQRFLHINNCGMSIDSEPGMGTTVTVSMPAGGNA